MVRERAERHGAATIPVPPPHLSHTLLPPGRHQHAPACQPAHTAAQRTRAHGDDDCDDAQAGHGATEAQRGHLRRLLGRRLAIPAHHDDVFSWSVVGVLAGVLRTASGAAAAVARGRQHQVDE